MAAWFLLWQAVDWRPVRPLGLACASDMPIAGRRAGAVPMFVLGHQRVAERYRPHLKFGFLGEAVPVGAVRRANTGHKACSLC